MKVLKPLAVAFLAASSTACFSMVTTTVKTSDCFNKDGVHVYSTVNKHEYALPPKGGSCVYGEMQI